MDTCCMDSPFLRYVPRFVANCLKVYGNEDVDILMVDACRRGWGDADDDGFVRDMCASNGEDRDDPFLAVPVTSLRTSITYKNYYCAVCTENPLDEQVAFWNVEVQSTQMLSDPTERDLQYDSTQSSWTMENDEGLPIPVTLVMQIPDNVLQKVKTCRSSGQVSECSPDWTDPSTAEKCSAYTAMVSTNGPFVRYKNPHCAICNFKKANDLNCEESSTPTIGVGYAGGGYGGYGGPALKPKFFVGLFIMEEERKKNKCNRGGMYDVLSKKCRTGRCRRNYTLSDFKCVQDRS